MELVTWQGLKDTVVNIDSGEQPGMKRVQPGDPEASYLFLKITKHRRPGDPRIKWKAMPYEERPPFGEKRWPTRRSRPSRNGSSRALRWNEKYPCRESDLAPELSFREGRRKIMREDDRENDAAPVGKRQEGAPGFLQTLGTFQHFDPSGRCMAAYNTPNVNARKPRHRGG